MRLRSPLFFFDACFRRRCPLACEVRRRDVNAHTFFLSLSQDNYITTRSTAIETIESTIAELGTIFSQLASMVAEQRETVQRIDADTVDIQK